ncbi:MAG: DNA primase [Desulfobacterales bacterium]|nr:DNA primase [Desulfobacterales bacterium]
MTAHISEDKIAEVKHAIDIVDVISEYVMLKKAGKNYTGLCPFHSEKTPSFSVSPEKQIFHCFGCGTGGNVFSFLMKNGGMSFPEAVKILARRCGVDIPDRRMTPEQKKIIGERDRLVEINKMAMAFYARTLNDGQRSTKAIEYIKKRGFEPDFIKKFNIGYAPAGWDNLLNFLANKQISLSLVERAGLIVSRENGSGFYDRFRDRIIFPIIDVNSRVIGFGGRVFGDELPKYLNSPETPLYNKRRSLFGLNAARQKCRSTGSVFIVEGYLDMLALYQHGIENVVATLGTALTPEHVRLLKGYAGRAILVYDSDEAGINAARRSIPVFEKGFMDAQILVLPAGYDPDSYVFEFGRDAFEKAASGALGVISFLIDAAVKKYGLSTEGKIRIVSEMSPSLAVVDDAVARSLYIKELAEQIGIDELTVLDKVRSLSGKRNDNKGSVNANNSMAALMASSRLERQITAMMIQFPEILPEVISRGVVELFQDKRLQSIGRLILDFQAGEIMQATDLMDRIVDQEMKQLVASLAISDESWNREGCLKLMDQFGEVSQGDYEKQLTSQIKEAEKKDDQVLLMKLLGEKQKMANKKLQQRACS